MHFYHGEYESKMIPPRFAPKKFKKILDSADLSTNLYNVHQWDQTIFRWFRELTSCEHITLRICGEPIDKECKDSDHNTSELDRYHRPLLVHWGYPIGETVKYCDPLSRKGQRTFRELIFEEKFLYQDRAGCASYPGLRELEVKRWIGISLIYNNILVGLMTFDRVEDKDFCVKQPDGKDSPLTENDLKNLLPQYASMLAKQLHQAFMDRQANANEKIRKLISSKVEPLALLEDITTELVKILDERGEQGIWGCEVFRRTIPSDAQFVPNDKDNPTPLVRWYPEREVRQFKKGDHSIALQVLKNHKPYIVFNTDELPQIEKPISVIRSMLAVPVYAPPETGGPVMAIMTLNSTKINSFSYYDQLLVMDVVKQAGAIIAHSSLLQFIYDNSLEITRDMPLGKLFRPMLENLRWLFSEFELYSEIALISKVGGQYAIYEKYDNNKSNPQPKNNRPTSTELPEFLDKLRKHRGLMECSLEEFPESWLPTEHFSKNVQGAKILAASIYYKGDLLGILLVVKYKLKTHDNPSRIETSASTEQIKESASEPSAKVDVLFSEIEQFGVRSLAQYVGVAVHNSQTSRLTRKLETATWRVMQSTSLQQALQIIADMARELVQATVSYVALLQADHKTIRLKAVSLDCDYYIQELPTLSIACQGDKFKAGMGVTARSIQNREIIIMNNVDDIEQHYEEYRESALYTCKSHSKASVKSELVVPILLPDQSNEYVAGHPALGALTIEDVEPDKFSEYTINIITKFATVAAVAIQRYTNPPHPLFTSRWDKKYESDIFLALKFSPPGRCQWAVEQVKKSSRSDVKYADATYQIGEEVWSYIVGCDLFIADMWGESTNVFYEIGLAHALNKPVILIGDQNTSPPTDLGNVIFIPYTYPPDPLGAREDLSFQKKLKEHIRKVLAPIDLQNCRPFEHEYRVKPKEQPNTENGSNSPCGC